MSKSTGARWKYEGVKIRGVLRVFQGVPEIWSNDRRSIDLEGKESILLQKVFVAFSTLEDEFKSNTEIRSFVDVFLKKKY